MLPITTGVFKIQEMETRHTQSGKQVTQLNLSCGEKNSKGDWQNLYIKATFWEKQSEYVSQYFRKGDYIQVQGKLITENYTKQDGTKVYETKFLFPNCTSMPRIDSQPQPNQGNYGGQQQQSYQQPQQQGYGSPQANQGGYSQPQQQAQPSHNPPQGQHTPSVPEIDISDNEIPF